MTQTLPVSAATLYLVISPCRLLSLALAFLLPASVAVAQSRPDLELVSGMLVVSFETTDGVVRAYLPDDVAPGERFSGSVSGPAGYSVRVGTARADTGNTFQWTSPPAGEPLPIIFMRRGGTQLASVSLQTTDAPFQEPALKMPRVVQAGRAFAIRGPFDGDSRTTRVFVSGSALRPLAESLRKAIVRAPDAAIGPIPFSVEEQRRRARGSLRSLLIELRPAADGQGESRDLEVSGLAGVDTDVPIDIAGQHFYLRATEVSADGRFTLRRRFTAERVADASLVIPQTRGEEVVVVLRTPRRSTAATQAEQHASDLRTLDFDVMPFLADLLEDDRLGTEAANALLLLDEGRAMTSIFDAIPQAGLSVQRIGFLWFLEHQESLGQRVDVAAHAASLRVLARIASTTLGELALYTVGLTGGQDDFPLLRRFASSTALGAEGLRSASETALARLGSRPHLEAIRAELREPLPADARYRQGLRVAQLLRKAGLTGSEELVPDICTHISDPVVTEIDLTIEPGRSAGNALSLILEGASPVAPGPTGRRSHEEWRTYCRMFTGP